MNNPYADIMRLSRPVSPRHLPMSMHDRAAQFSPFAALTGYDAAIEETARLTSKRIILDEDAVHALNCKYQCLMDAISTQPPVSILYFAEDERKDGGSYLKVYGNVKKIDPHQKLIFLSDGSRISFYDVLEIESELFKDSL